MDIISLISEQATSVSLAIVVMWFYNKLVADFLLERKEIIEGLRIERKEWQAKSDLHFSQLLDLSNRSVTANNQLQSEIHTLKSKITELFLTKGVKNGNIE